MHRKKIVSSPDHGNHCDFQQVSMILPTFWTLLWYGNLLEVNFQLFGHFHGMGICYKSTSNLWTLLWYGNLVEVNFQPFGHFHDMEIWWKYHGNLVKLKFP